MTTQTILVCDACGATTSNALRPDGWACLHIFVFDAAGNPGQPTEQHRCARCMKFLTPEARRELPTLPDGQPCALCHQPLPHAVDSTCVAARGSRDLPEHCG